MSRHSTAIIALCASAFVLSACGDSAKLPEEATIGPNPTLPEPVSTLIPTVDIAPAKGWPDGVMPTPASGLTVTALAKGLDHPRWLFVLPNGDVLVAETNAPERPERKGPKTFVMNMVMKRAGAAAPSANRITLLRDADGDGVAETRTVFLKGPELTVRHGADRQRSLRRQHRCRDAIPVREGTTEISEPGTKVADLPGGPLNHHWTKGLTASPDGSKLYASVGSNSNVGENGIEKEDRRAAIIEIDVKSGQSRVFAGGLRNPVGIAFHPQSKELWAVVNERDEIGSDLVPDYLTSVKDGGFYGWPYSYFGKHVDTRVKPPRPDLVEKAIVPDYALGNHVAPLGFTFASGDAFPETYRNGGFVGLHGSWNRTPLSGYKVIFVPFKDGKPDGKPLDVLTGFVNKDGDAHGRPVGVEMDKKGALLVADDVGNIVWRVAAPTRTSTK